MRSPGPTATGRINALPTLGRGEALGQRRRGSSDLGSQPASHKALGIGTRKVEVIALDDDQAFTDGGAEVHRAQARGPTQGR